MIGMAEVRSFNAQSNEFVVYYKGYETIWGNSVIPNFKLVLFKFYFYFYLLESQD